MHYQENLQQNVEIIQLSVHMFEESLGKKYLCWTKWDEIISEFAFFLPEFSLCFIRAIKGILEYI